MEDNKIDQYRDMLDLPHHVSEKHRRMSAKERAAQFASFAALTGFDNMIKLAEAKKTSLLLKMSGDYEENNDKS